MFDSPVNKHLDAACRRFHAAHNAADLAARVSIRAQVLRNKLNPEQPHQLTVVEVVRLTSVTGDRALIDGMLRAVDCLPSIPCRAAAVDINAQTLNAVATVGDLAREVGQLGTGERLTATRKNRILERTSHLIACASVIAISLESRFHSTPTFAAAIDMVSTIGMMPGLS